MSFDAIATQIASLEALQASTTRDAARDTARAHAAAAAERGLDRSAADNAKAKIELEGRLGALSERKRVLLRDRDEKAALRDALETEYRQLRDAAAAVEASEKVVKDRYEQTLRSMNAAFTNSLKGIQAGVSVVTHFPVLEDL